MKSLYYKNLNTLWNTNGDIHVYLTEKALGASDNSLVFIQQWNLY